MREIDGETAIHKCQSHQIRSSDYNYTCTLSMRLLCYCFREYIKRPRPSTNAPPHNKSRTRRLQPINISLQCGLSKEHTSLLKRHLKKRRHIRVQSHPVERFIPAAESHIIRNQG